MIDRQNKLEIGYSLSWYFGGKKPHNLNENEVKLKSSVYFEKSKGIRPKKKGKLYNSFALTHSKGLSHHIAEVKSHSKENSRTKKTNYDSSKSLSKGKVKQPMRKMMAVLNKNQPNYMKGKTKHMKLNTTNI
jgi:hypothetical protein